MSKSEGRLKWSFFFVAALTLATFAAANGQAATDTWSGAGADANWMTPGNWDTLPVALDILQFAGTTKLTNNDDFTANTQFNGINFNAGAGSFVLGGNSVLLGGDINDNSTNAQTVNLGFVLDGATSNIGVTPGGSLALGQLTFGLAAQSANVSTLNLNNSVSATGLTVQTKSTSNNTISVASGTTFSISGPVKIGTQATTGGAGNVNTNLSLIGGGNLVVSNISPTSSDFFIGLGNANLTAAADRNVARVDMTQLANFTYTTGSVGTGRFGVGWGTRPDAQLRLTPGTNTIIASAVNIGNSSLTPGLTGTGDNSGGTSILFLGAGTNIINTPTLGVGITKGAGTINWQDSANGSVTIAGQDGISRTNITVGNFNAGSATTTNSQILLAGHNANVMAGTVIVGRLNATGSSTNANQITFDKGTFDVNSLQLAVNVANASGNGVQGTFTLGTDASSTGVLNVNTQFLLGNDANVAVANTKAIFNVNGGTANINSDIQVITNDTDTTGDVFTINQNAGTLNMMGHNIGSAASPVKAINFNGGTVSNIGTIAGQSITIGSGVTIGGAPSFVLANGGTLQSSLSPLTLSNGGGLSGGGATAATINGDVVAASGSRVTPGNATVASTLQFSNNLSFDSGSTVRLKLSENAGSGNDLITVGQNLSLAGTVNLEIGSVGAGPHFGNTYTLFTYGGTLSGSQANFNVIAPVATRSTYTLLPTSTTSNSIQLQVAGTAPLSLTWIGNVNNNWDLIGALNWHDPSAVAQQFFNQDSVTFDDTSTNLNDVQLAGQLLPSMVTVNATRNYKFVGSGAIAGGALTKSGSGTLIIANSNTYTGNTDIQTGTLQIGDSGTAGNLGAGTISNAAVLSYRRSDAITVSNAISGAGIVRQDGAGTMTLSGNSTFSGGLNVNSGAVRLTSVTGAGTGGITVNPGATLVYGAVALNPLTLAGGTVGTAVTLNPFGTASVGVDVTAAPATTSTFYLADPQNLPTTPGTDATEVNITGTLHGSGNITVLSNGQDAGPDAGNGFRLRGTTASDFTGRITLGNTVKGEIQVTDAAPSSPAGTGTIVLTAGTVNPGTLTGTFSELNVRNNHASGDAVFGNNIEMSGAGLAVINPLSTASPETSTLGNLLIGPGQTLAIGKNAAGVNTVAFQSVTLNGTGTFAPNPANMSFSGSANLILGSISELTPGSDIVMAGKGTLFINSASTYTGPTTVSSGTLQLAAPDVLPNGSKLVLAGGTFNTGGNNETVNTLVASSPSAIDLGAGASVLHFADSHLESWQGPVTITNWSGNLTTGAGTDQVFFGSSNAGLSGSQVSSIHFNGFNGATLLGTGELIPVSISNFHLGDWNADGTVNSADIPVMLNALTDLNAYASATSTLHSAYPFALTKDDLLNIGDVNVSGSVSNADIQSMLDLIVSLGGGGSVAAVPEPASFALFACGGMALALAWSRRRANRS